MNMQQTIGWIAAALVALTAFPATAQDYPLHGRVSYDAGGGLIKGAEESDYSTAAVNTLVLAGDTLWADDGSTTELEFSGGTFLRLADGSKAEVVALPPGGVVRGWVGSFYVQRLKRSTGDMLFETPAARIDIGNDTSVRIDIQSNGAATVSVRWGSARLFTDVGDGVNIGSGQRVWVDPGLLPSEPASFNRAEEDAFDAWNRERAEFLANGPAQTPQGVNYSSSTIGYSDLDRYGEWVHVDNRQYWRPTVVVDYVPYRYGYWSNNPRIGNVWVGNYPFSYTTSHYGRWRHHGSYGWIWSYDPVWSPAWATTVRYGDYLLWSPVDYYSRPVAFGGSSAYFTIGGVRFGYFASSCVPYNSFYNGYGYGNHGYAYASPFSHSYYDNHHGNVEINIWNINGNGRNQVRTPYESVFTERNYNPRRSIRGPQTTGSTTVLASDRVQGLETRTGRGSFTTVDRTGARGTRTAVTAEQRSAQPRVARVSQSEPGYARATRSNPVNARESFERSTGVRGSGATRTLTNSDAVRVGRENPVTRAESSTPRTTRGSGVTVEAPSRGSETSTRTIGSRGNSSGDNARTVVPQTRSTSRSTVTPGTRSVQTAPSSRSITTTPRGGSSSTSTRSSATPQRDSGTSSRVITTPRATSPAPRTGAAENRTPVSRQGVPSTRTPSTPPRISTAPSISSRRIAPPSRSYTAPSRSTSTPSTRSTAPPSRSYTAPSRSTSTPSTRSVAPPSRSFSSPAPSRRIESAPSSRGIAPSRSIQSRPSTRSVAPSAPRSSSSSSRSFGSRSAPSRPSASGSISGRGGSSSSRSSRGR